MDGVEGDEGHFFDVGLAVLGKIFFVTEDVDNLGYEEKAGVGFMNLFLYAAFIALGVPSAL